MLLAGDSSGINSRRRFGVGREGVAEEPKKTPVATQAACAPVNWHAEPPCLWPWRFFPAVVAVTLHGSSLESVVMDASPQQLLES